MSDSGKEGFPDYVLVFYIAMASIYVLDRTDENFHQSAWSK